MLTKCVQQKLPPVRHRIVAYDYGMKENILRRLRQDGFGVTVVPATTTADEVLALNPDGVFLSNGPGDPGALQLRPRSVARADREERRSSEFASGIRCSAMPSADAPSN